MDHHALNSPPSINERQLRYTAKPPMIADRALAVGRQLARTTGNSAAANISHAVAAVHTVRRCRPAHPPRAAKLKAIRLLTANKKPASAHGENVIVRVTASHATATTINSRLNPLRKLPVASVPVPAYIGNNTRTHNAVTNRAALKLIASHNW